MFAFSFASNWPCHINGFGQQDKVILVSPHSLTKLDKPVNYLGWILQNNAQGVAVSGAGGDVAGSAASTQWAVTVTNSALLV
jgi:hypothetical protein